MFFKASCPNNDLVIVPIISLSFENDTTQNIDFCTYLHLCKRLVKKIPVNKLYTAE